MSLCGISRRRLIAGTAAAAALSQVSAESLSIASAGREAVVYQTTSLTAEGLVAALRSVQSTLKGRIAVKLHTGEPHGPNILPREWVKALINELPDAVIVETNTLYGGPRAAASRHRETLVTNGWTFAPVKDADAKTSPYLVPYDELSEEVKDYDREPMRGLVGQLAAAGLALVRR